MEIDTKDWRLLGRHDQFHGAEFHKVTFIMKDLDHDHVHCWFCWDKFSEHDGDLHDGYETDNEKYWVCPTCFNDFKEYFGWKIIP